MSRTFHGELEDSKVSFPSNVLSVEKLVIMLLNVLIEKSTVKGNNLKRERVIMQKKMMMKCPVKMKKILTKI